MQTSAAQIVSVSVATIPLSHRSAGENADSAISEATCWANKF